MDQRLAAMREKDQRNGFRVMTRPSARTVMSILQDSHGYLWLATESGLDRFDGYAVREYRRERGNDQGLASDYVWALAEDSHGDLWLATQGGGVARWDRRTDAFQQFRHDERRPDSLASDAVRTLLIDTQGYCWPGRYVPQCVTSTKW